MEKNYSLLLLLFSLLFSITEVKAEVGTDVVKFKTNKSVGSAISMDIQIYDSYDANEEEVKTAMPNIGENVSFEGATMAYMADSKIVLTVDAPEITVHGNIYSLFMANNGITDVDLSGATKLSFLRLNNNQIKVIDLSKNPEMVELWATDCSELQSVNLANASKLMTLALQGTAVSSLDFTDAEAIRTLYAGNNSNLSSLNLSNLSNLDELWVNNNGIESLDLSNNTYLMNLECSRNRLTSLDVSACSDLNYISCWGNNIKGEEMDKLIKSLPVEEYGVARELCVFHGNYTEEHNELNEGQIATVKTKGWVAKKAKGTVDEFTWIELTKATTGIDALTVKVGGNNGWFDINGRRISTPATNGIYIHNGKKVLVK